MRVLVINGSRRKKGNTRSILDLIVRESGAGEADVEFVHLGDLSLSGCTGCEGCRSSWECVIKDDFSSLVEKIDRADAILLGSPTYWYSVTSDMKSFIDRCYSLIQFPESRSEWISRYDDMDKKAITLAVCEQHEIAAMGNTSRLLQDFCRDLGFDVLASVEGLGHFEARSVLNDEELLARARQAGRALAGTPE